MDKRLFLISILLLSVTFWFGSCKSDDDDSEPVKGTLNGDVVSATGSNGIEGAELHLYNANTNSPTGLKLVTNASGHFETELDTGRYFLKIYKQGFESIPPRGMQSIPFAIVGGETKTLTYNMHPSVVQNGGWITGKITNAPAGTLVVADNGTNGFSSVTAEDGSYTIYNVEPGSYTVKGWYMGYDCNETSATVASNAATESVNLSMTAGAGNSLSGQISFLATTNIEVDVTLTHIRTRETIPGLSVMTTAGSYNIENVPAGIYVARASFMNDGKVIDPDWIVKNGEPIVTINVALDMNFSVTGAVELTGGTNDSTTIEPLQVSATPEFTWAP